MDKEQHKSQNVQQQTEEFTVGAQTVKELSEKYDEEKQEMKHNCRRNQNVKEQL